MKEKSTMRLVVVESPYAGRIEVYRSYLIACLRDCFLRGESPYASHAIGPLALRDDVPDERALGMRAGFAWRVPANATVVYEDFGVSKGMAEGIAHAESIGCPVERRRLGGEWAAMFSRFQSEMARNPTQLTAGGK
jgi:hypothetical protein